MRIHLEPDDCVGHGRCYTLAPEVFDADDFGHCVVVRAEPPDELAEGALAAVRACPERALSVEG